MFRSILLLIFTLLFASTTCKGDVLALRRQIAEICRNGTTVSDEVVESLIHNDYVNVDPTPQNSCYARCVAQQFGFSKENGDYNRDHIIQETPKDLKDKMNEYMDACKDEVGVDSCQTAFKKNKCFFVKVEEGKGFFNKVGDYFKKLFG